MAAEHSAFPALTPAIITKVNIDPSKINPFGILPLQLSYIYIMTTSF
jgi:hypothetical protein